MGKYLEELPRKCPACHKGDLVIENYHDLMRVKCTATPCSAKYDVKWYPTRTGAKLLVLARLNPALVAAIETVETTQDEAETLRRFSDVLSRHEFYTEVHPVGVVS